MGAPLLQGLQAQMHCQLWEIIHDDGLQAVHQIVAPECKSSEGVGMRMLSTLERILHWDRRDGCKL